MTSLDGLRALEQAASPGPWRAHDDHWIFDAADDVVFAGSMLVPDDAEFVVAARNALPGLLGRVAAAEAERDAYRAALVRAGVPLEVLRLQIEAKPYRELTRDFQRLIVDASELVRAVLAASVPSGPARMTLTAEQVEDVRILIRDYYSGLPEDHAPVDGAVTRLDYLLNDEDGEPLDSVPSGPAAGDEA